MYSLEVHGERALLSRKHAVTAGVRGKQIVTHNLIEILLRLRPRGA
jgi:hypothetical protein